MQCKCIKSNTELHIFKYLMSSCSGGHFYMLLLGNVRVVSYLINQTLCHINKGPEK